MKTATPLIIAAMFLAAPALAQEVGNAADNAVVMTEPAPTGDPAAAPANELGLDPGLATAPPTTVPLPMEDPVAPQPAPEQDRGFPWGILGLLGLVGLLGRKMRSAD